MSLIIKANKIREACETRFVSANLPLIKEENAEIIALSKSRQFFFQNFREEFSYDSNAIEGNRVTLPETYEILRKNVTINGKPLKDQMEIIGHAKAFDFLVEKATDKNLPLSQELMLAVHKMIFEDGVEFAGRFRNENEFAAVGNPATGEIFHKGVNPVDLITNIEGLVEMYNDISCEKDINIIGLLAAFHICFEKIHPFKDGNGRTGRLLVNFELMKHGYLPIDVKFAERTAYYAAFEKDDDYTRMTELFTRSMFSSAAMYKRLHEQYVSGNADKPPVYQADTIPYNSAPPPNIRRR